MSSTEIAFEQFCLFPKERLVLKSGRPIQRGSRAFDILSVLLDHPGLVVPKQESIARVWPNTTLDEANLTVHMTNLRRALETSGANDRLIVNVPGRGYLLTASVEARTKRLNFPEPRSELIGRAGALEALSRLLSSKRFITIVGEGGIGKTSTALAVGQRAMKAFDREVYFVDLASIGDAGQLSVALRAAFSREASSGDTIRDICVALNDARVLLILDNCEHVSDLAASVALAILKSCPGVQLLATSREPLRTEAEHVYRLLSLDVPPPSSNFSTDETLGYAAARMFADCVASRLGEFDLADRDAPFIGVICRRLDGLPLGIELAARRVASFGVRGLTTRLENDLDILMGGCRREIPRHQSLKSTFDWSYALLGETERRVLRRLAVFDGVFAQRSASTLLGDIHADDSEIVDILAQLVTKCLVVALDVGGSEPSYRLLNTTRAYARKKLIEAESDLILRCRDEELSVMPALYFQAATA